MIKTFAIIGAGIVTNLIDIDDIDTASITAFSAVAIPAGQAVAIGWAYNGTVFSLPALSLSQVKELKKTEIRNAFEIASNANITVSGVVYQGGYEKAMRLDAAKRLSELSGVATTTFYDLANVGHTLAIVDATAVVLAISTAFQTEFSRKQARMVAIDAALTAAAVNLIVY